MFRRAPRGEKRTHYCVLSSAVDLGVAEWLAGPDSGGSAYVLPQTSGWS
jgi:hypothetical protein